MPPLIIRMSTDLARSLGAVPTRKSLAGLDLIDPAKEIFVWTRDGTRLAWPKIPLALRVHY